MTDNTLKVVKAAMQEMGLEYAFRRFRRKPGYPYFVGDYMETDSLSEDGLQECTVTLTASPVGLVPKLPLKRQKAKSETISHWKDGRSHLTMAL